MANFNSAVSTRVAAVLAFHVYPCVFDGVRSENNSDWMETVVGISWHRCAALAVF